MLNYSEDNADPNKIEVYVVAITQVSCFLSMIGSLVIIITYAAWKDIRTVSRQLLVFLSLSDFVTAAGYAYGNIANTISYSQSDGNSSDSGPPAWCLAEGIVANCAQMMSFFWTVSIAIFLYITIVKSDLGNLKTYRVVFHTVSWGIPVVIISLAVSFEMIGSDKSMTSVGWCWIKVGGKTPFHQSVVWMLVVGKGWEILSYFVLPAIYIAIKLHIWSHAKRCASPTMRNETLEAMLRVNRKLTFIPLVFVLLRSWGTLRFILFLARVNLPVTGPFNVFLQVMQGIGDSFQGGANCIIFCVFTESVRHHFVDSCKKFSCCKRQRTRTSSTCDEKTALLWSKKSSSIRQMSLPQSLRIP